MERQRQKPQPIRFVSENESKAFARELPSGDYVLYAKTLNRWRLTPTEFAVMPEDEQAFLLAGEMHRQYEISEWRKLLIGDSGDVKESKLSPEAATMLRMASL